ncbi:MAG: acyl-CoA dehydrogenase family protein [Candidatus Rokubacteria bacterium]|nr:acyl-CoA dehydrogenase family protein [Candidatus Rokubacteria bacterium]
MATFPAPAHPLVAAVSAFVEAEVRPVARALEHADRYPHELVARLRELGLFGSLIPREYGGLALDVATYARVIEELCRGWMSLAGVLNSHMMLALIVLDHGTEDQRRRFLPRLARGHARGGLCLTEPHAGSDVQAIRTVARPGESGYVINGTKMFVTNGREGNTFAVLALTDPGATPRHRGMSCFIVEKGHPGLRVVKSIGKLGYKGVDTAELLFENVPVPADHLVGGVEGRGFSHVMSGLETGRINIAARAVGVAQAALDEARRHARARAEAAPALADMATRVAAARRLTYWAAGMKDRAERCDLEAGMAKLWASESAQAVATDAMRVIGPDAQRLDLDAERHYRDTPLMIIGEGTNEIQRLVIARQLLERHGERLGALTSRDHETAERRQMVLAVRQFVEKMAEREPAEVLDGLGGLGLLGALVPPDLGGLGLDPATYAMLVEELARGGSAIAGVVAAHVEAGWALARLGAAEQRALLPSMTRGQIVATAALGPGVTARRERADCVLDGALALVPNAARAQLFVVAARAADDHRLLVVLRRDAPGLRVATPAPTLGPPALGAADLTLEGARVPMAALLEGDDVEAAEALARVGLAATAVGVAQAAFEAALRYSQQRVTFGKPIGQHQAIQLKLADMATTITAARLLTAEAAERLDLDAAAMAKVFATEMALTVTLEAMRIHGGYGYTTEFPVERYYRETPRLVLALGGNDAERAALARRLA